jgi:hypothetical protein
MLRARAESGTGPWEQWQLCYDSSGNEPRWTIFSNADGLFASTEMGYTGGDWAMLRARAQTDGSWERYAIGCVYPGGSAAYLWFWSGASQKYVSTELGFTGGRYAMLRARAGVVDGWETYVGGIFGIC